jgi:5-methylcytosine-specific restriction protein A
VSPYAPAKPCAHPLCPLFVEPGTSQSRCSEHLALLRKSQDASRGTPAQRGYGVEWRKLRAQILERDGGLCTIPDCGQPGNEVDHITPKHQGGTDDPSNLASKCRRHHASKTGAERQRLRDRS